MDAAKLNPVRSDYRRLTPALVVKGAENALRFYREVFNANVRMRFPGPNGTVAHAELEIGDSILIVEDEYPERGTRVPEPEGIGGASNFIFI